MRRDHQLRTLESQPPRSKSEPGFCPPKALRAKFRLADPNAVYAGRIVQTEAMKRDFTLRGIDGENRGGIARCLLYSSERKKSGNENDDHAMAFRCRTS